MLSNGVGACFSKTFSKIAEYYEVELLDYRKADKVYRLGQDSLKRLEESDSLESFGDNTVSTSKKRSNPKKEFGSLQALYQRFCDRMMRKIE